MKRKEEKFSNEPSGKNVISIITQKFSIRVVMSSDCSRSFHILMFLLRSSLRFRLRSGGDCLLTRFELELLSNKRDDEISCQWESC